MVVKKDEKKVIDNEKIVRDGNKDCCGGAYVKIAVEYKVNSTENERGCQIY